MPTIAPRFQSEGVRIGSMPVPQAKVQNSMAEVISAIGDTVAGLGKTVDRVQAVQEHRAKAQQQADETGGADIALEWRSRNEAKRAAFNIKAIGSRTYNEKAAFDTGLAKDNADDLLEGKSEGMRVEANRRIQMYRREIQAAADQHASNEHRMYTKDVASKEKSVATGQAAVAKARGDSQASEGYIAQAGIAGKRLESVTGVPFDANELVTSSNYGAYRILEQESPHSAISYYEKNKGSFGKYEDDVARSYEKAKNTVAISDISQNMYAFSRDDNGVFSVDLANQTVKGWEEHGQPPEVIAALSQKVQQMAAHDLTLRNQEADALKGEIMMKQATLTVEQQHAAFDVATQPELRKRILRLTPEGQAKVVQQIGSLGQISNQEDYNAVRIQINNPFVRAQDINLNEYVLKGEDFKALQSELEKKDERDQTWQEGLHRDFIKAYEDNTGKMVPKPSKKGLKGKDAETYAEVEAVWSTVRQKLSLSKDRPTPEVVSKMFAASLVEFNGLTSAKGGAFSTAQVAMQSAGNATMPADVPEYIIQRAKKNLPAGYTDADLAMVVQAEIADERVRVMARDQNQNTDEGSFLGDMFSSIGDAFR